MTTRLRHKFAITKIQKCTERSLTLLLLFVVIVVIVLVGRSQLTVTCENVRTNINITTLYSYLPTVRRRTDHTSATSLEIQSGSFERSTIDDRSAPRHVYELDPFKTQRRPESKLIFDDRSLDIGTSHVRVFATTDTNRAQKM